MYGKPSQSWISRMPTLDQNGSENQGGDEPKTAAMPCEITPNCGLSRPTQTGTATKAGIVYGISSRVRSVRLRGISGTSKLMARKRPSVNVSNDG